MIGTARAVAIGAAGVDSGGGGSFSPDDVSGLVGWFDADAITGLSDGNAVSSWSDESGNGNHATQATGSAQPTYKTGILNSKPVVRFDGGDWLATASALFSGSSSRTIFVVYKSTSTGTYTDPVAGQSNTSTTSTWFVIQSRTRFVTGDPYLAGFSDDLTGPTPDNAWKYAMASYNGTTAVLRKNGTQVNSGAKSLNTGTQAFEIGADNDTSSGRNYLVGDVAEVLVYTAAITGTDLSDIETYLANKWGL